MLFKANVKFQVLEDFFFSLEKYAQHLFSGAFN